MLRSKKLFLIRHAQSYPRASQPDREWALSSTGRVQATELVPILKSLHLQSVISSPYQRCVGTVAPFCEVTGVGMEIHSELRERRIAPGVIDNFLDVWKRSWEDFDFALDGCESSATCQKRILAAVKGIGRERDEERIGVSTHGNAISLLLNALDSGFDRLRAEEIRNPDLFLLEFKGGELRWISSFEPPGGLLEISTSHEETPIEYSDRLLT